MVTPSLKRILFVAENVTTDQVTRLVRLAGWLPRDRFHVVFATACSEELAFAGTLFERRSLGSLPRAEILRSVGAGKPAYDAKVLSRYLADDCRLLNEVQPDLIVANFRPSLTVSAPLGGVPMISVISAVWSPFAVRAEFPVPDHPLVDRFGPRMAQRVMPKVLPAAFTLFAKPVNALRKEHGLPPIGDLLEVMTWGDLTLHPDVPELAPTRGGPSSHQYLGWVPWSAPSGLPSWWGELDATRPAVYLTLGSSGNLDAWPALVEGLEGLPVDVLLATAGRIDSTRLPGNFWAADFLPGDKAAGRASLAITNGGAGSSHQALAQGTPVIGIASNLDQFLSMQAVERAGAGRLLRAGRLTAQQVRQAVRDALDSESLAAQARRLASSLRSLDSEARFVSFVDQAARLTKSANRAVES